MLVKKKKKAESVDITGFPLDFKPLLGIDDYESASPYRSC